MKITITKKLSKKIFKALKGFMSALLILSLYTCVSEEPAKPDKTTIPRFDLPVQSAIQKIGFAINSSITFQLTSNVAWSVADNQGWCSVSPAKGKGTNTAVTITVKATTANTGASARNCTLTFTATGVSPNPTRSVTQNSPRFDLPAQKAIQEISYSANSTISFQLTSDVAWSVAANPTSWCSISPASGVAKNTAVTITVKATTANRDSSVRNCTLTFTVTGVSTNPTRSVTQLRYLVYTVGSVQFKMGFVPAKKSFVGLSDTACTASTTPPCVTRNFYMAETEVTYELWSAVYTWATATAPSAKRYTFDNAGRQGGNSGSGAVGTNQHPVTTINWYDAIKFSNALTEYYNATNASGATDLTLVYGATSAHKGTIRTATGITHTSTMHILNTLTPNANATGFRLPREGEWELAARFIGDSNNDGDIMDANEYYCGSCPSGSQRAHTASNNENSLVAWFDANSSSITHAVKGKRVNALGLYDMSGNVGEWSFDWHTAGTFRAFWGGGYGHSARFLQVSNRSNGSYPAVGSSITTFRLAKH